MYSELFNTRQYESNQNPIIYNGVRDYYNVLWIIGAIASFIFIIILIIVVSVHLMQKNSNDKFNVNFDEIYKLIGYTRKNDGKKNINKTFYKK